MTQCQRPWVQIQVLLPLSCVTVGRLQNFPVLEAPRLQGEMMSSKEESLGLHLGHDECSKWLQLSLLLFSSFSR